MATWNSLPFELKHIIMKMIIHFVINEKIDEAAASSRFCQPTTESIKLYTTWEGEYQWDRGDWYDEGKQDAKFIWNRISIILKAYPDLVADARSMLKSGLDKSLGEWYSINAAGELHADVKNLESEWESKKEAILRVRVNEYAGGLWLDIGRSLQESFPEPRGWLWWQMW